MRNRIELAKYFAEHGFTYGAEVGVYKGEYSEILFKNIPRLRLVMVDSWAQGRRVPAKEEATKIANSYNGIIAHLTSLEAASMFNDGVFDFVFIDADHSYESVRDDLVAWTPKVRAGGIVALHDYYEFPSGKGGVIKAVDEFVQRGYKLNVIPWDKTQSTDNRQPCAWFVK